MGPTVDDRRVGGIGGPSVVLVEVLPGLGGSGGVSPVLVDVDPGGGGGWELVELSG